MSLWELTRNLRARKAARKVKSQSALQGVSTGWKRLGDQTRALKREGLL